MARPTSSPVPAEAWPSNVVFQPAVHRERAVILVRFPYNAELIARVKQLPGARWSRSLKAWYVADNAAYRQQFGLHEKPISPEVPAHLSRENTAAMQRFLDTLRLKGYSPNTERTYRNEFAQLLQALGSTPVDSLTPERIRSYLLYCINELKGTSKNLEPMAQALIVRAGQGATTGSYP